MGCFVGDTVPYIICIEQVAGHAIFLFTFHQFGNDKYSEYRANILSNSSIRAAPEFRHLELPTEPGTQMN